MYPLLRPLLFTLDAESSHEWTLAALRHAYRIPGLGSLNRSWHAHRMPNLPRRLLGIDFANPVGLAAGLDKHAQHVTAFADIGFGFLELGTVTPRAQPGNPRPRLFRLPADRALINRMGFNSVGLDRFLAHLARQTRRIPIGINLGKNRDTPAERAIDDYRLGLRAVYRHADYVTINISSPNTPGLRGLQAIEPLTALLAALKQEQTALTAEHDRYTPIAIKIAPDLDEDALTAIARAIAQHRLDAVIATNTTVTRPGLRPSAAAAEAGGLSGAPLRPLSLHAIGVLYAQLAGKLPIIGVGGIGSANDAWNAMVAGADLVQIYTALIYDGPSLVRKIVTGLTEKVRETGTSDLARAVQIARSCRP